MRALIILVFLATLVGCANERPAVERQTFLVQVERTDPPVAPVAEVLRLGRVAVASPFDERALVYRRDDVRYQADFYNQFAADPSDMLGEAVAGWLRQSGLFRRVIPPGAVGTADYRLESSVSALYIDFQSEAPAAVLDVRWQLVREDDGSSVLDVDCRERVALAERSPAGAVRAYQEALRRALGKLEKALAAARL